MAKRSSAKASSGRVNARSGSAARIHRSAMTGRFVTGAPVRTKAGSVRLTATLKSLGADPKVVDAADGD